MIKLILVIIYVIFTTSGLVLLKLGGNSLSLKLTPIIEFNIGYITLLGFACYIVSFLLWQKLLSYFELSLIVPITTGIVQVVVLIIGILIFKEKLNLIELIGIFLIIIGVILMTMKK